MTEQTLTKMQQFWFDHIRRCESEKLSPAQYCKNHNLIPQRFYAYKSDLRKKGILFEGDSGRPSFVPVQPVGRLRNERQYTSTLSFRLSMTLKTRFACLSLILGPSSS